MEKNITRLEDVECLGCGAALNEDGVQDLCGEPYNGIIWECPKCKKENSLDLFVRISEV